MQSPQIVVLPDVPAIAREAADRIVAAAAEAIGLNDTFSLSLSGGSTPKLLFDLLATEPYRSRIEWKRTQIFFCDERCVPSEHTDSNFRMAHESLLSKVPIPSEQIHRMRGEIEPNEAAKEYGLMLKERFADRGVDLALLGMGDDGHTASLFPGTPAVIELEHRVVAQLVQKSTTGVSWRITMTAPFLNRSRQILFLVAGASKAARLSEVLEGPHDPARLPAQLIDAELTHVAWLVDVAAVGMNEVD